MLYVAKIEYFLLPWEYLSNYTTKHLLFYVRKRLHSS